jgi:predicted NBD/HSP70 family sugar kinase
MDVNRPVQATAPGLSQALTALHLAGGTSSRAELTRELGCSRSVMGYLLGELAEAGLVTVEPGSERPGSGGGRPSQLVRVAASAPAAIAAQLGTEWLSVARIGIGGEVLAMAERPLAARPAMETVLEALGTLIAELAAAEEPAPFAVAIAVPSPVSRGDGRALAPLHLGWPDLPLRDLVREQLARRGLAELPVEIANDANLAALAESRRGAGRGAAQLLYLTTEHVGLGGGLVTAGQLVEGAHGYAIEPGHFTVNSPGAPCTCGSSGCLEVEADNRALLRFHGQPDVPQEQVLAATERLLAAAEVGEAAARAAAAEAALHLGTGLASLVNLFDPDRVVLGQSLGRLWQLMPEQIASRVATRAFLERSAQVPIRPAALAAAPLLGAAELALDPLLADPRAAARLGHRSGD